MEFQVLTRNADAQMPDVQRAFANGGDMPLKVVELVVHLRSARRDHGVRSLVGVSHSGFYSPGYIDIKEARLKYFVPLGCMVVRKKFLTGCALKDCPTADGVAVEQDLTSFEFEGRNLTKRCPDHTVTA
jgi:hypothetical protein